jgi:phosphatidylserine decarboxylase
MKNSTWQYFIPQHLLSRAAGYLANTDVAPIRNFLIEKFIKHFNVDMSEALIENPRDFNTFNDFFTRELKPGVRPIDAAPQSFVSPADGALSEWGTIHEKQLLQAKGRPYSLSALLADQQDLVETFHEGTYATIYLSPRDYHRVHMPLQGKLKQMVHVPGNLFSVNQKTTENISDIFARNERVICIFDTVCGPVAMILVGAMIVASIATVWHGQVTPTPQEVQAWQYAEPQNIVLDKGAEMGRFYLGSTVVMLFPKNSIDFDANLTVGQTLKLGQPLGSVLI